MRGETGGEGAKEEASRKKDREGGNDRVAEGKEEDTGRVDGRKWEEQLESLGNKSW